MMTLNSQPMMATQVQQAAPDLGQAGFFILRPNGCVAEANDVILQLAGQGRESIIDGKLHCRDLMTAESALRLEAAWSFLETQGYIEPFEADFISAAGPIVRRLVNITALRDGTASGSCLVLPLAGQIQRPKLKEPAENSEPLFRSIFETSFQMTGLLKLDGTLMAINEAAMKFVGIDPTISLGRPFWECSCWGQSTQAQEKLKQAILQVGDGQVVRYEASVYNAYGVVIPIDFSLKPVLADGQVRMLIAEGLMITEERREQAAILRLNEELNRRFDATFEQAAVGIAHVGPHREFLRINQKYCNILGYSQEELENHDFATITFPEDQERDLVLHEKLFDGELNEFSYDKRYIQKNGSVIWVHLTVTAVKNEHGKIEYNLVVIEDITERKQVEFALRESEERFRIMADASPIQIYDVGPDGKLRFVNKTVLDFYGPENGNALLHDGWLNFVHPEDRERMSKPMPAHSELESVSSEEFRIRRRDGEYRWVMTFTAPSFYPNGELHGLIGSAIDITERKQIEFALQESEERFRIMANASPSQIFDISPDGMLRFMNQTAIDFYGPEREQEISQGGWQSAIHPDDREMVIANIRQAMEMRSASKLEARFLHKDGRYRWLLSSAEPSFYPDGSLYGLVGSAVDITERKQIEEALQQSETRWRELANAVPIILWVTDAKGDATFLNERWFQYTGIASDSSIGSGWMTSIHPDDRDATATLWQSQIQQGELFETEIRYLNAAGQYRWHLVRAIPIKDPTGTVLNWYGTSIDIQDRRLMEQELGKARDIAEEASRKKSQFLANMSHELRTPLNAVIGFSDMMRKGMAGALTQKQGSYVEHISTSGRHLLAMVNDILDISKAEAGRIELVLHYVDLEPFILQLKEMVIFGANKSAVQVEFDIQPGLVGLVADPDRLKQIFLNLIGNAIKFNHAGGKVQVFLGRSEDQRWIVCEIQDTGIGISQEHMGQLFTEFYQVDSSNARRYEGTGLGLALTKRLVELHKGVIFVESQEGVGSLFTFKLPINPYAQRFQPEETSLNT